MGSVVSLTNSLEGQHAHTYARILIPTRQSPLYFRADHRAFDKNLRRIFECVNPSIVFQGSHGCFCLREMKQAQKKKQNLDHNLPTLSVQFLIIFFRMFVFYSEFFSGHNLDSWIFFRGVLIFFFFIFSTKKFFF